MGTPQNPAVWENFHTSKKMASTPCGNQSQNLIFTRWQRAFHGTDIGTTSITEQPVSCGRASITWPFNLDGSGINPGKIPMKYPIWGTLPMFIYIFCPTTIITLLPMKWWIVTWGLSHSQTPRFLQAPIGTSWASALGGAPGPSHVWFAEGRPGGWQML